MSDNIKGKLGMNVSFPHLDFGSFSKDIESAKKTLEPLSKLTEGIESLQLKFCVQRVKDFDNLSMRAIKDIAIENGYTNMLLLNEKNIVKLFDRETPKAPLYKTDSHGDSWRICPSCWKPVVNVWNKAEYKPNYCHYCGQRYDWEVDK